MPSPFLFQTETTEAGQLSITTDKPLLVLPWAWTLQLSLQEPKLPVASRSGYPPNPSPWSWWGG